MNSRRVATTNPPSTYCPSVLVVEDYPAMLESISRRLRIEQLQVYEATSGEAAIEIAHRERPDLALIDYGLPGLNGVQTAAAIRTAGFELRWILFSAAPNPEAAFQAGRSGALRAVWTPFNAYEIVRQAIEIPGRAKDGEWSRLLYARRLPQ